VNKAFLNALDIDHMHHAMALARRGLGRVHPNPAVGCILVRDDLSGQVVGRGWTQPGGRPHAETEAIRRAGALSKGATAYVTLEPCNHQGQTGPCSDALIRAGVRRVVVAIEDPDPRTAGAGIDRLKNAGIEVTTGVLADQARRVNAGFISRITRQRPMISWKTATSMDGRIATMSGDSKWITGDAARRFGHFLRARYDAIMIGSKTASADDPSLTCRLPGMEDRSPIRIVVSGRGGLNRESQMVRSAPQIPTLLYTLTPPSESAIELENYGVTVIPVAADPQGNVSVSHLATDLADRGVTRLLVEGGGSLAASFLRHDLIDRIYWFRAPILIGREGRPALGKTGFERLSQSPAFTRRSNCVMGADTLEILDRT